MSDSTKKTMRYPAHMSKIVLPPFMGEKNATNKGNILFSRQKLETLASGVISSVFGPLFQQQDHYERQVRMPEPPLLLADRVLRIEGEPGSMASGIIWTETDVTPDAWYLNQGYMPSGIMVESGQADLLLASWLGIDFHNKGERTYRLLGCELSFHGPLAKVGETLSYEIHLDRFTKYGDIQLMFFHYDCLVDDKLRLSVRNGQAGFFTDEELKNSRGVVWTPEEAKYKEASSLDPAPCVSHHHHFTQQQLTAFSQGNAFVCFGEGFESTESHTNTPHIQPGKMLLLTEITTFDIKGGPAQRGYMRAIQCVDSDDWYFKGHFKNDPCMPGTLMAETGMQLASFYLAALGFTLNKDGWRFEPAKEHKSPMHCRGQCLPTSKEVVYEIFVDELIAEPYPTLFVDLLATVDGVKAFYAHRFSVMLVPPEKNLVTKPIQMLSYTKDPHLDPTPTVSPYKKFSAHQLRDFTQGNIYSCFGDGFEYAETHNYSPHLTVEKSLPLDEITEFNPRGGQEQRGYMRAVKRMGPDDASFQVETLITAGYTYLLAFYLTALGLTLDKDAWRFELIQDPNHKMQPCEEYPANAKEIVYELYVDEIIAEPIPRLLVELLITIDGVTAFYYHHVGMALVPDYPLSYCPEVLTQHLSTKEVADDGHGFRFDYAAMISAAWGKPGNAFGKYFQSLEDTRKIPRLPGPPYHFMSRVTEASCAIGSMQEGCRLTIEYDIPQDAWYFANNDKPVMPFAVLMEVALQPCGWLASYVGCPITTEKDLYFRNLDGTGTLSKEITPAIKMLATTATLTKISKLGNMILVNFDVSLSDGTAEIYKMQTKFGYFLADDFKNQAGLPISESDKEFFARESNYKSDLTQHPKNYFGDKLTLCKPMLLMIDRITGYWPETGPYPLGKIRGEKTVNPAEWFFKAHFYRDPVQPGSLGCQALAQLLQAYMIESGMGKDIENPSFETIALDNPVTWKYRGQVVPHNKLITLTLEVLKAGKDTCGVYATARGSLWVDGKRIYELNDLTVRIKP